ncbi:3-oxoacyl-[acyl-carrier-protein] synthase, KASII [hydrothermal vent metagenome]|uniref:3-oxoacyl-[acyl-carrier-protein] synthase, KASII n=1 Tax=hydrothermal vent metagenome TaxID=652676 RepID=A0A3B0QK59_9ZZZZ
MALRQRQKRVVVTGVGIITAHGMGYGENLVAMKEGRDSIGPITAFDASAYRGTLGGEVKGFSFDRPLTRLRRSRLDRSSLMLLAAFDEALAMAGLDKINDPIYMALGTTLGGMLSGQRYHGMGIEKGFDKTKASLLTDYLAHSQAANLMEEYGLKGQARTFSDACASGTNAIGSAFEKIRSGAFDIAISGGYDTMCEFTFAGFNSLQAVTPERCRPFDKERDGLVLGEGAGLLILEDMEYARRRGAAVLGEVTGYGTSSDAFHSTRPDPEARGAVAAINTALESAGVSPGDIDYINAHGTATPYNDLMEARAIAKVFGKCDGQEGVPVSSVKSMIGHLLGASGAVEAISALMAIREGFIPPNINCGEVDPECNVNISTEPNCSAPLKRAISNSFGFGGANACLVLEGAAGA